MIGRDMVVEAEIIEQPRRRSLKAHHRHLSRIRQDSESRPSLHINPTLTFSTISANSGHSRTKGSSRRFHFADKPSCSRKPPTGNSCREEKRCARARDSLPQYEGAVAKGANRAARSASNRLV